CTVVLDHLGKPPVGQGIHSPDGDVWLEEMEALARLPLVSVKLSGLAPEADPSRPLADQVIPFLDATLAIFGATRCMAGSDWPVSAVTPHRMSNIAWFELVRSRTATPDHEHVFRVTAERVYRLER
ncbi:TPA: amidohydrolase family protein, partial [Legionella pneumophila]|nr:amidohydrolase family protein [Legionella pneumophila]